MDGTGDGNFGAGRYTSTDAAARAQRERALARVDIASRLIEAEGERAVNRALFGWAILWAVGLVLAGVVVGAYLLKSWMGIDLFGGHSVLHGVVFG